MSRPEQLTTTNDWYRCTCGTWLAPIGQLKTGQYQSHCIRAGHTWQTVDA